jgi:hypothetical protein
MAQILWAPYCQTTPSWQDELDIAGGKLIFTVVSTSALISMMMMIIIIIITTSSSSSKIILFAIIATIDTIIIGGYLWQCKPPTFESSFGDVLYANLSEDIGIWNRFAASRKS